MNFDYDFVALGGGSAGYHAARTAASLGAKTALVDGAEKLGGLCILRGCMPSKTLLHAAEVLHQARTASRFGLRVRGASVDLPALRERKRRIIGDFARYRQGQLASGNFDLIRQYGRFHDAHTVELADGTRLRSRFFLIGTGSRVAWPNVPGLRDSGAWTSDDILDLAAVPRSVLVLGGGVVACELAQYLRRIGARVTMVQRGPRLLRDVSPEASEAVAEAFRREEIELILGTHLERVYRGKRGATVVFTHQNTRVTRRAAHLFNALGREPATDGLNLAAAGVAVRTSGHIITNAFQQTTAPHIYAGGDCCGPYEIVHLAVDQGATAARHALGKAPPPVEYRSLLTVVFTDPQVARLGLLEREHEAQGEPYLSASYSFNDHGKSILMEATDGYVKIVAEPKSGLLRGAEIVGRDAGELIHTLAVAQSLGAKAADLLRAPWYHPTLSEILTYPLEEIAEQVAAQATP